MKKYWIIPTLVLVFVAGLSVEFRNDSAEGSVLQGQEYLATTTDSTSAGTNSNFKTTANGGTCAFGSVVIASSTIEHQIEIRNATSTTDVASTTIATFEPNAAEGTYTFDLTCDRGLSVITPASFNGVYIITYR